MKHEQSLTETSATELLEARKALQQTLEIQRKSLLFFKKKIYYIQIGRFLARAPQEHKDTSKNILDIKLPDGTLDVTTEAIATNFHVYYSKLYNLPPQHRPPDVTGDRAQAIQDYLNSSGLPKLSDADTTKLEDQISSTEIQKPRPRWIHIHLL